MFEIYDDKAKQAKQGGWNQDHQYYSGLSMGIIDADIKLNELITEIGGWNE